MWGATGLNDSMRFETSTRRTGLVAFSLMVLPMLLSTLSPVLASTVNFQEDASGLEREDIWSAEYSNFEFPWGGNDAIQFKEYHTYETMKDLMLQLASTTRRPPRDLNCDSRNIALSAVLCSWFITPQLYRRR